jgi:hypothetical protein
MSKSGLTTLLVSDRGGLSATRAVRGADRGPSERPGLLPYQPSRPSRAFRGTRSGRWSGPACRGACALASDAARAAAGWPKPVGNATAELPPGFRMPPVCHWPCRWRTPLHVNSKRNGFTARKMVPSWHLPGAAVGRRASETHRTARGSRCPPPFTSGARFGLGSTSRASHPHPSRSRTRRTPRTSQPPTWSSP